MATWAVLVDWDGDASFADPIDDITQYVIGADWRLGMSKAWQTICDEPTLNLTLRNTDGRFNPERTDSPLYGYLLPNKRIKITKDGTVKWIGFTDTFTSDWEAAGDKTGETVAKLTATGFKKRLQDALIAVPLYEQKRTDEIIADILLRVVLPPATANLWVLGVTGKSELGVTTRLGAASDYSSLEEGIMLSYYGDLRTESVNKSAWAMLDELVAAERGKLFQDENGKVIFWNRDHLLDDTVTDGTIDSQGAIKPIKPKYSYGDSLINEVRVACYPRTEGGNITLWSLDSTLTIEANSSIEFEAKFKDGDGKAAGAYQNVAYGGVTWGVGSGAVSISAKADRATVTVSNTSSSAITLTAMNITGDVITSNNRMEVVLADEASVALYGKRPGQNLNLTALTDYADAFDICEWELNQRAAPRGEVKQFSLINPSVELVIGDRLRVTASELGHDKAYFVVGMQQTLKSGFAVQEVTYILEPALARLADYDKSNLDSGVILGTTYSKLAQAFIPSASMGMSHVRLRLLRAGNAVGNLTVKLYSDTEVANGWLLGVVGRSELGVTTILGLGTSRPDTLETNGTSESVSAIKLGSAWRWVTFNFATPPSLVSGTKYWLVLETSGTFDASNHVKWGADGSSPSYADGEMLGYDGSWQDLSKDAIFEVYGNR